MAKPKSDPGTNRRSGAVMIGAMIVVGVLGLTVISAPRDRPAQSAAPTETFRVGELDAISGMEWERVPRPIQQAQIAAYGDTMMPAPPDAGSDAALNDLLFGCVDNTLRSVRGDTLRPTAERCASQLQGRANDLVRTQALMTADRSTWRAASEDDRLKVSLAFLSAYQARSAPGTMADLAGNELQRCIDHFMGTTNSFDAAAQACVEPATMAQWRVVPRAVRVSHVIDYADQFYRMTGRGEPDARAVRNLFDCMTEGDAPQIDTSSPREIAAACAALLGWGR